MVLQTTHPQLSKSISCRISNNSSNIGIFNKYKHIYNNALKNSGYRKTLKYTSPKSKPKHRNRNITWFNPPYNKCVISNISRDFLNLISKHFPNHSLLAKIFNRNNIKLSYRAAVKTNNSLKQYMGAMEGAIKQRIYNHKLSFTNKNDTSNTSLSSYIWCLINMNLSSPIT